VVGNFDGETVGSSEVGYDVGKSVVGAFDGVRVGSSDVGI